jgi:hypothetical protein
MRIRDKEELIGMRLEELRDLHIRLDDILEMLFINGEEELETYKALIKYQGTVSMVIELVEFSIS